MAVRAKTQSYVVLTLRFQREGQYVVGKCQQFEVSSFGSDFDEALQQTIEAVETHLEALTKQGELGAFLRERGLKLLTAREVARATMTVPVAPEETVFSHAVAVLC